VEVESRASLQVLIISSVPPAQHAFKEPQKEAERQVKSDLEDSSDRVISGRVTKPTKTAKQIRGRVTGDDMKSSKKKKPADEAGNTFLWTNEAG
jgi:hypothetical protein